MEGNKKGSWNCWFVWATSYSFRYTIIDDLDCGNELIFPSRRGITLKSFLGVRCGQYPTGKVCPFFSSEYHNQQYTVLWTWGQFVHSLKWTFIEWVLNSKLEGNLIIDFGLILNCESHYSISDQNLWSDFLQVWSLVTSERLFVLQTMNGISQCEVVLSDILYLCWIEFSQIKIIPINQTWVFWRFYETKDDH